MGKVSFGPSMLPALCDLLMAAAHADDALDGNEVKAVEDYLQSLSSQDEPLPEELRARIAGFDPASFSLEACVSALGELSADQRRAVLEMLADLSEADETIDMAEDEFLRSVAKAIGASDEDMRGLTVDIEIVPATSRPKPPPVPVKKSQD